MNLSECEVLKWYTIEDGGTSALKAGNTVLFMGVCEGQIKVIDEGLIDEVGKLVSKEDAKTVIVTSLIL